MLESGTLNKLITIERATETRDSYGAVVSTWATLIKPFAQVTEVPGWERLRSGREMKARAARFLIRHYDGLTSKDRIVYSGLTWDISSVEYIGRNAGVLILAEARD